MCPLLRCTRVGMGAPLDIEEVEWDFWVMGHSAPDTRFPVSRFGAGVEPRFPVSGLGRSPRAPFPRFGVDQWKAPFPRFGVDVGRA